MARSLPARPSFSTSTFFAWCQRALRKSSANRRKRLRKRSATLGLAPAAPIIKRRVLVTGYPNDFLLQSDFRMSPGEAREATNPARLSFCDRASAFTSAGRPSSNCSGAPPGRERQHFVLGEPRLHGHRPELGRPDSRRCL